VLLDIQLPDFDGFEVARRLAADPAGGPAPVVVLRRVARRRRTGTIHPSDLPPECWSVSRRLLSPLESIERDAIVQTLLDHGNKAKGTGSLGNVPGHDLPQDSRVRGSSPRPGDRRTPGLPNLNDQAALRTWAAMRRVVTYARRVARHAGGGTAVPGLLPDSSELERTASRVSPNAIVTVASHDA
jgi:hypothetical protein